jgi:hypothetical protein
VTSTPSTFSRNISRHWMPVTTTSIAWI